MYINGSQRPTFEGGSFANNPAQFNKKDKFKLYDGEEKKREARVGAVQ